jgi:hypothetical protein
MERSHCNNTAFLSFPQLNDGKEEEDTAAFPPPTSEQKFKIKSQKKKRERLMEDVKGGESEN